MPRKPDTPCAYPGCPRLVASRYCSEHARAGAALDAQTARPRRRRRRGTPFQPGWRERSAKWRERHPWCEVCLQEGRLVEADAVHHQVARRDGGTDSAGNLKSLCAYHHGQETARETAQWRLAAERRSEP